MTLGPRWYIFSLCDIGPTVVYLFTLWHWAYSGISFHLVTLALRWYIFSSCDIGPTVVYLFTLWHWPYGGISFHFVTLGLRWYIFSLCDIVTLAYGGISIGPTVVYLFTLWHCPYGGISFHFVTLGLLFTCNMVFLFTLWHWPYGGISFHLVTLGLRWYIFSPCDIGPTMVYLFTLWHWANGGSMVDTFSDFVPKFNLHRFNVGPLSLNQHRVNVSWRWTRVNVSCLLGSWSRIRVSSAFAPFIGHKLNPVVARNSKALGSNPGRVRCLLSRSHFTWFEHDYSAMLSQKTVSA